MLGILLIDKPLGGTSHDVVNVVRRRFGTRRVGHAGTLDPLGTGLLVVAVGPATRFLQYLPLEPKEYLADITFGRSTDTYDAEGETTEQHEVPDDLETRLVHVSQAFMGLIEQIPPMHSAVKVKGKPLYRYARAGEVIERASRRVHIGALDLLGVGGDTVKVRVECSGGTYIRTLANDLGQAIGCGAYLSALHRTRVGKFRVEQGVQLDAIAPEDLIPLAQALHPMPVVELDDIQTLHVREGRQLAIAMAPEPRLVALADTKGEIISVARVEGTMLQPECVIPAEMIHDRD